MKRPDTVAALHRCFRRLRLLARPLCIKVYKRIQLRLYRRHPFEMRLHNLDRRNSLLPNPCSNLRNRCKYNFVHGSSIREYVSGILGSSEVEGSTVDS